MPKLPKKEKDMSVDLFLYIQFYFIILKDIIENKNKKGVFATTFLTNVFNVLLFPTISTLNLCTDNI